MIDKIQPPDLCIFQMSDCSPRSFERVMKVIHFLFLIINFMSISYVGESRISEKTIELIYPFL